MIFKDRSHALDYDPIPNKTLKITETKAVPFANELYIVELEIG